MKFRNVFVTSLFVIAVTTGVFADHMAADYDHAINFQQFIWDDR